MCIARIQEKRDRKVLGLVQTFIDLKVGIIFALSIMRRGFHDHIERA